MDEQYRRNIINSINGDIRKRGVQLEHLNDLMILCREEVQEVQDFDKRYWFQVSRFIKASAARGLQLSGNPAFGETYYDALLFEAPHKFESYLYYMEKNRSPQSRFYQPREKTLSVVTQDLQDLEDGLIKFYGLSLPSRTGKALAKDTPVLTKDGWKNHGDLRAGDMVIGEDGNFKKVIAVHPDCDMEYEVTFSDGEKILCHGNHEWKVYDRHFHKCCVYDTNHIYRTQHEVDGRARYLLPLPEIVSGERKEQLHKYSKQRKTSILSVKPIPAGTKGNCITVEGGLYRVGKTLKLTHNSTIAIFYMSWHMGRHPNSHNAMGGHSGKLAKGFYNELLNLISTPEYTFAEIFPSIVDKTGQIIESKSAEDFTINLGKPDRFATMTCRGIEGTWTGAIDISPDGILYTDDLIRDREHSLSAIREENTYQEYLNKMVDRMNDGASELMIGTLWNVMDPLERERKRRTNDPKSRFRRIPALDEITDESNFDYAVYGFSTEYYRNMRSRLDKAEWMAKFQQKPFVREGLLLPADELRYFNGILPDGDHRIVAACDVAWGGGDSLSMPIGAEYENGDVYIFDWIFNSGTKEVTIPIVAGKIMQNSIRQIRFEANNGGDMYCQKVSEELISQKYACSCTHKKAPGRMEKMSKMVAYSGDIKRNFVFLSETVPTSAQLEEDARLGIKRYYRSAEYQNAMDEATSTSMAGDNEHDDACDGLTQLAMTLENNVQTEATILKGGPWGRRRG